MSTTETEELQCTACPFCGGVGSISYNPNINPNAFQGFASARCGHCDGSGVAAEDDVDTHAIPPAETETTSEKCYRQLDQFRADMREACKAFPTPDDFPHAWLMLDGCGNDDGFWYEYEQLFGLPVYRTRASLTHSGHDGEHQTVIPLWRGDVSRAKYDTMRREFEARLAKSGDF